MRLLFVTKRYYSHQDLLEDRFGRLFHLPRALALAGHDVAVVALDYRNSRVHRVVHDDVSFTSLPLRGFGSASLWRWLREAAGEFLPDAVVGSTDTHLGWTAERIAKRHRVPFIFDVYDNYRAFASARIPGMNGLFERLLRRAQLVSVVSDALEELAGPFADRIVKIPNGVDRDVFKPAPRDEARRTLGLRSDAELVGYVGSIEPNRGVEVLLEAVALLQDEGRDVKLLVAGRDIIGVDWDADLADYRGLIPHSEVPAIIGSCDVVVLPYLPTEWGKYTYPYKLAEYAACGVPIVATALPEFASFVGAHRQGLCDPGDADSMKAALVRQLDSPELLPADAVMTWSDLADRLAEAIASLV